LNGSAAEKRGNAAGNPGSVEPILSSELLQKNVIEADWTLPAGTRPVRQSKSQNSKWRSGTGFGLERLLLTDR